MEDRLEKAGRALLEKLEQAAAQLDMTATTVKEKHKGDEGEEQREYTVYARGTVVDTGALKRLTAALKDIRDVLYPRTALDIQEQLARLQKIQQDLERHGDLTVEVLLDEELAQ